ncbi:MAG: porin [Mesorhizobium sp.]|nr:porin [Mesorhizobium sp.]MBL8580060.1 porin [Mesorhizobium sp.]
MLSRRPILALSAALLTVPAARAADAVVIAEPEPMEYVRICDTYGVGFYYIPGTETCLKVSGYMRFDAGVGAFGLTDLVDKKDWWDYQNGGPYNGWEDDLNDTYAVRTRFQLRTDARQETELGTLRGYAAINFQSETYSYVPEVYSEPWEQYQFSDTADFFQIEHAYIELAGFRVGKTDSLFSTFTGYGGGVINDDIIPYGPYGTNQIAFGWSSDSGLGVAVALETGDGDIIGPYIPAQYGQPNLYTIDSYMPHVTGGIGWEGAWGGVSAVAGYDSVWEQGAVKGRVDFYPTDRLALFAMAGWGSYDKNYVVPGEWFDPNIWEASVVKDSPNYYAPWGGSWAVWGGGSFILTDKATINVQASYDAMEDFALVANVAYELVPNLTITPEVAYIDNFNDELPYDLNLYDAYDARIPTKNWGFFVRAQMNFGG